MAAAALTPSPDPFSWVVGPTTSSMPGVDPPPAKDAVAGACDEDEDDGGDDFEFRLPASSMLSADELFSDGKLVPLHPTTPSSSSAAAAAAENGDPSPEPEISNRSSDTAGSDPSVSSPRAPGCTSRWRDLLGFKKSNPDPITPASKNHNPRARSLKRLLHRTPKSGTLSDSHPLLPPDPDPESSSSSSSSSDSGSGALISLARNGGRVRLSRTRTEPARTNRSGLSPVESPRMNSSGKVVFERSSSSPGSFHGGGARPRPRGMERSYSANVRVDPVLNVPVWSNRTGSGFGLGQLLLFSSPQRKEKEAASVGIGRTGSKGKPEKLAVILREKCY